MIQKPYTGEKGIRNEHCGGYPVGQGLFFSLVALDNMGVFVGKDKGEGIVVNILQSLCNVYLSTVNPGVQVSVIRNKMLRAFFYIHAITDGFFGFVDAIGKIVGRDVTRLFRRRATHEGQRDYQHHDPFHGCNYTLVS